MRSLTGRLVATAVALVALVSLVVVALTTVAMQQYLTGQLDSEILAGPDVRPGGARLPKPEDEREGEGDLERESFGQRQGILWAEFPDAGAPSGELVGHHGHATMGTADLALLADVPRDGRVHAVDLAEGPYRVVARDRGPLSTVAGLPTSDITHTLTNLLISGLVLAGAGVLVAALLGLALVRRQLRPLREVAATAHAVSMLPLSTGEIHLTQRVPARLTDERTEVGQVGSALNTLLAHVETSLEARHQSEQQVRQFVADASHELRTPLATITGYTELARRRPDDAEVRATALTKIEAESGRMNSLVEDLLLLARLDSGRPLEQQPIDLSRLLVEAVSDARVLAPDHHWRIDLPDEPLEVFGDDHRLHQVVTNLLTNARLYTPPGTTVTVTGRPGEVTVHDDGPGFPPELVPTAFERFARGDVARTRTGQGGIGLGLSLVKAIVMAHGGTVGLESVPGDTTVTVRLPGPAGPAAD